MTETEAAHALTAFYGIRLPDDAARFAAWWGGDETRQLQFGRHFLCDICIASEVFGPSERPFEGCPSYATDPPELVAMFGAYARYGYLGLAPEIEMHLPFVCSDPNSYDIPVYLWSDGLADGLESYLGEPLGSEFDLQDVFGRSIQSRDIARGVPRDLRDALIVPKGYRYERGTDVTGVLAPSEAFKANVLVIDEMDDFDEHLAYADTCIRDGQPASAILVLRDIRTVLSLTEGDRDTPYETVLELWSKAAMSLGREGHAKTLDRMIDQHIRAKMDWEIRFAPKP